MKKKRWINWSDRILREGEDGDGDDGDDPDADRRTRRKTREKGGERRLRGWKEEVEKSKKES